MCVCVCELGKGKLGELRKQSLCLSWPWPTAETANDQDVCVSEIGLEMSLV